MIIHEVQQGSESWIELRLGIPTASEFHRIVTPKGALSAQADKYAHRLIAEGLLKRQLDSLEGLEWIDRGKELEEDAARMYQFQNEVDVTKVGFITTDNGLIGASPDRLISKSIGLECKCPSPQVHVSYMLGDMGDKYKPQVQGQNYVGEFEYSVLFSYNPEFPPVTIKTPRDEDYIKILAKSLDDFCNMKAEMLEKIRKQGYFAEYEKLTTSIDATYGEQANA